MPAHRAFYVLLSITCCITLSRGEIFADAPALLSDSWESYHAASIAAAKQKKETLSDLKSAANVEDLADPPKGRGIPDPSKLEDEWFESAKGKHAIACVLSFQGPNGGWSKNIDFLESERAEGMNFGSSDKWISTFDNKSTVPQIRLLAKSHRISRKTPEAEGVLQGLNYIFRAQYPSGGWPQIYPLAGKYHDSVTYNDDAMVSILSLLFDTEKQHPDFAWIPTSYRKRAQESLERGIAYTLASQVKANGELKGWAQQYDPRNYSPVPARAFEMVSISSAETSSIIDFLIQIETPSPEIVESIRAASAWLESTGIEGYDFAKGENGVRQLIPNADAKTLWARFYEIESNSPLFGDRDGSVHYSVDEISVERRNGYAWYTRDPLSTLNRVRKWEEKR